jgi:hypothetical protein
MLRRNNPLSIDRIAKDYLSQDAIDLISIYCLNFHLLTKIERSTLQGACTRQKKPGGGILFYLFLSMACDGDVFDPISAHVADRSSSLTGRGLKNLLSSRSVGGSINRKFKGREK